MNKTFTYLGRILTTKQLQAEIARMDVEIARLERVERAAAQRSKEIEREIEQIQLKGCVMKETPKVVSPDVCQECGLPHGQHRSHCPNCPDTHGCHCQRCDPKGTAKASDHHADIR